MKTIQLYKTHHKFESDAISFENDRYKIETDGVFLGISTRGEHQLANHIIHAYQLKGETFISDLRGSFSLYLLDKDAGKHLVYTNHVGDKRIYYYHSKDATVISSSLQMISEAVASINRSLSPDIQSMYYMLTYGFMFGDRTIFSEVKRLKPGHYMILDKDGLNVKPYFVLNNEPDTAISEDDALEQVDYLFRKAVHLEFDKDIQYGYTPLCSLSGGLDSRMTTWVGHEMGYTAMVNFTFARNGSPDMIIPKQITDALNHPWLFQSLDAASFFFDLEEVTRVTGGYLYYLPISHSKYALDQTDFAGLGILHTGQLGDVTLGSYMHNNDYGEPAFTRAISSHFIDRLPEEELREYNNLEQQLYLNRGFNFILSGNLPVQQHTEATSPFLDVDFLNFAMSLPLHFRVNHRLYKKWIMTKYPAASNYAWEKLGTRINARTVLIRGKHIPLRKLPAFVFQGIKFQLGVSERENRGMNPFQFWYNDKREIQLFLEQYFRDYIDVIPDKIIKQDCEELYSVGNIHEKTMVLSLLATLKLFWN